MCYDAEPDFKDHDPHNINSHIKLQFRDVLAEPDQFHSCDCVWQATECCYTFMFTICYGLPVGLCHLWISLGWGLEFGSLFFWHIWCINPLTHCVSYIMYVPANCFRICTRCVLDPCFEACSYVFMFCKTPPDLEGGMKGGDDRRKSDWHPMAFL